MKQVGCREKRGEGRSGGGWCLSVLIPVLRAAKLQAHSMAFQFFFCHHPMLKRKVEASFLDFGPTSTTDSVKSPIPGLSPGLGPKLTLGTCFRVPITNMPRVVVTHSEQLRDPSRGFPALHTEPMHGGSVSLSLSLSLSLSHTHTHTHTPTHPSSRG